MSDKKNGDRHVDPKFSILAIILAVVFFWFWGTTGGGARQTTKAANKEVDADLNRGLAGALMLKNAMRDPDSFTIEKATIQNNGKSSCYEYRAKNGFGGFNRGQAVLVGNGIELITNEQVGFRDQWSLLCANKAGRDFTATARYTIN